MPYRVENNCVQVNHGGKWETVPGGCHKTAEEARRHLRAIEANTHGKAAEAILHAVKIGRVLSAANEREITAAVNGLITVLQRAGIDIQDKTMTDKSALDDCAKEKIPVLMHEHPEWDQDQAVAAAFEMCRESKSIDEQLKALDPDTAQAIIDAFNTFAQQLTDAGVVEAAQGQTAENEPPDEAAQEQPQEETPQEDQGEHMAEDMPPKKKPPMKKEASADKMDMMPEMGGVARPTQEEVNYIPHTENHGTECEMCRWFLKVHMGGPYCHLIENHPMDILPTGHCDRWETMPEMQMEPIPVTVVETGEMAIQEDVNRQDAKPAKSGLVQAVKNLFTRPTESAANFSVFKGADGRYYWLARHTNNFEDRDQEILSSKAHDAYVARVNMGLVDPPELWIWHSKGSRIGAGDIVWRHDHFVFAMGHFEDNPVAQRAAKTLERRKGRVELSHGFTYPTWALKDGVYTTYNTFEISVLPEGMAANPYTSFEEIETMALSDRQRQWIKEVAGEEGLARVERAQAEAEKDGETLKALDKRYKDFAETVTDNGSDRLEVDSAKLLKVVAQLIDAQGDLDARVEAATSEATAQKALREKAEAKLETMQAQIDALNARLDLRPRSGIRAKETDIENNPTLKDAVKEAVDNDDKYEMHPTFGRILKSRGS